MNDDRTLETGPGAYPEFQAPGAGTRATFYVRVFDWRGDARPDLVYEFSAHPQ